MTPWIKNTASGVAIIALSGVGAFMWNHLAEAQEKHDRGDREEVEQTEIGKLVEQLGKRAASEDAAMDQTIKLCIANAISDCAICRDVGIETKACK